MATTQRPGETGELRPAALDGSVVETAELETIPEWVVEHPEGELILVGAQWGDEGKGKVTDTLAEQADIVLRYQGGNNAGHTVIRTGEEPYYLHMMPSGILSENTRCALGKGVVINVEDFTGEMSDLEERGVSFYDKESGEPRLLIDPDAHVITTFELVLDKEAEEMLGSKKIGTTAKGIGPTYAAKVDRSGIRIRDLLDREKLGELVQSHYKKTLQKIGDTLRESATMVAKENYDNAAYWLEKKGEEVDESHVRAVNRGEHRDLIEAIELHGQDDTAIAEQIAKARVAEINAAYREEKRKKDSGEPIVDKIPDPQELADHLHALGKELAPYIADVGQVLKEINDRNGKILFEGAQGTHLDINEGTYPNVTSSNTVAGGGPIGAGTPPDIEHRWGIVKAYVTRVGSGPNPTRQDNEDGERLQRRGGEVGVTTGRTRDCGWQNLPLLEHSVRVNGFNGLVETKLDTLSGEAWLPVCTEYRIIEPLGDWDVDLEKAIPEYVFLPGWTKDISNCRRFEKLPFEAKMYIAFQQKYLIDKGYDKVVFKALGVGPDRDEIIPIREGEVEWFLPLVEGYVRIYEQKFKAEVQQKGSRARELSRTLVESELRLARNILLGESDSLTENIAQAA